MQQVQSVISPKPIIATPKIRKSKKSMMQKQIPTLLGIVVLVIALVAGLLFFKDGTGVFAPRATPQTTPKNVKATNVTDKSFTVVFFTDESTASFIKYGTEQGKLKSQISDDRDQLSGTIEKFSVHHITLGGLDANTNYYFVLGTGSSETFDNQGAPFTVRTAKKPSTPPPAAKTAYGNVLTAGGTPAEGSVVFLNIDGLGEMSSLVKSSGSWAIPLSNAWTKDGSAYAAISDTSALQVFVQGIKLSLTTQMATTVGNAQPVPDLTLGQAMVVAPSPTVVAPTPTLASTLSPAPTTVAGGGTTPGGDQFGGDLDTLLSDDLGVDSSPSARISTASATLTLSGEASGSAAVVINQPLVIGQVIPNVEVQISIHSKTEIEQTVVADENGEFQLDLASLEEELEPGEHNVTYTYVDPETGQEVTQTHTFFVEDTSSLIAQADTGDVPYGSGEPYPIGELSPTVIPTLAMATESAEATDSGETKGGTRSAIVSTESGTYQAGNATTTLALVIGGLFFIFTGLWSWWVASELGDRDLGRGKMLS